jgi:ABC-type transport system involved in multi-copper enzyme maturation permease subunit
MTKIRQIRLIATKEFGDRFRSGWVITCIVVWLGAITLTSFFGLLQIGQIGMQGYERTVITLLNLVQYFVPLLALLLGHDLIVSEAEERTLKLLLASGLTRWRLLAGKFLGGCLTLAAPLLCGFLIAGTAIAFGAKDRAALPFIRLAVSGLGLGVLFIALGQAISVFCRTRVRALVAALLAWCLFVFVFDLVALSVVLSSKSSAAAREIELVCDATHVNAAADIHSAYDNASTAPGPQSTVESSKTSSLLWLTINPVDLFRVLNLPQQVGITIPFYATFASCAFWLLLTLGSGLWKFRHTDL